jgi:hypothetical protein
MGWKDERKGLVDERKGTTTLICLSSTFCSWMELELIGVEMEGSIREMETCSVRPLGLPSNPFIWYFVLFGNC